MKKQVRVSVQNITNEHVHFERLVDIDGSIATPYDTIVSSLLWLYNGLNVKVVIETANV